jgi:hypothetical protein
MTKKLESLSEWITSALSLSGQSPHSRHFDEIDLNDWAGYRGDILPTCLAIFREAVEIVQNAGIGESATLMVVPLEPISELPGRNELIDGWSFLRERIRKIEPPSLYLMSPGSLWLRDVDVEEYRFPFKDSRLDSPSGIRAYVRYWRDLAEINSGEEFWGGVYFIQSPLLSA